MATNTHLEDADQISFIVPTGTLSGEPVLVGAALPGVCLTDADADDDDRATVKLNGSFHLEIVAAAAMVAGDEVFIDAATFVLSDTAADVHFGYLLEDIGAASTVTRPVKVGW
jgi:predicted RecA/RadA family phage recombinase